MEVDKDEMTFDNVDFKIPISQTIQLAILPLPRSSHPA